MVSLLLEKCDSHGNLITTKQGIIKLYEEEYKQRLTQNPPHQGLENLQLFKKKLFKLRLRISSSLKTEKWTINDLISVTRKLKNKKARDSEGFIYELFKPNNCGKDVHESLLSLFNDIKEDLLLPIFFQQI